MPDNMNFKNSPDSKRINIHEAHEVTYWTQALGCSQDQLKEAVAKVGTSADAVRNYIKGSGSANSGSTRRRG